MIPAWKQPTLESFFGPAPGGSGYLTSQDLLGIPPGPAPSAGAVAAGLQRRLAQIAGHPDAGSEHGDMVRRWLMEAAEELLAARGVPGFGPGEESAESPPGSRPVRFEPADPFPRTRPTGPSWSVIGTVFVTTALLSAAVLWLAVRGITPASSSGASGSAVPAGPAGARAVSGASIGPSPATDPRAPSAPGTAATAAAAAAPRFDEEDEPVDGAGMLRLVRRAAERSATDRPGAAAALGRANAVLERRWAELAPGERTAALDAYLETLLRLSGEPALARDAVRPLLDRLALLARTEHPLVGADFAPLAWSTGVLVRLERERELPAAVLAPVSAGLRNLLGSDRSGSAAAFPLGAVTALRAMPLRLVIAAAPTPAQSPAPPREPAAIVADLKAWEVLVRAAVATPDPAATDRLAEGVMLDGMQRLLTQGPDADADRGVYEAIAWFAASRRWRAGDPSRRRLLQWLDDARISSGDLHALTASIVGRSAAEGLNLAMILPPTAGRDERAALRQAYEQAWNLAGGTLAPATWAAAAREELAVPVAGLTSAAVLRQAAVVGAINQAAWLRAQGKSAAAEAVLLSTRPFVKQLPVDDPGDAGGGGGEPSESPWAARFVQERTPAGQATLLANLGDGATLTEADAEIITELAFLPGVNAEVREAARKVLGGATQQRRVVHAALKILPRTPRTAANATLMEVLAGAPLPVGWQHERWPAAIRAGLVERLLELLAARAPVAVLDRLSIEFARTYEVAAGAEPPAEIAPDAAGTLAADAAERLFRRLRARAGQLAPNAAAPLSLERIDQRLAGRLSVARGKLPEFAAFQASSVEAFAYVVSAENPARAPLTATIIQRLDLERRDATHIFAQLYAGEAAMLRLHLVAAGEGTP